MAATATGRPAGAEGNFLLPSAHLRRRLRVERAVRAALFVGAMVSVATTVAIAVSLLRPTFEFFGEIPVGEFFSGTTWAPLFRPAQFGVWPLVTGTFLIMGIAVLVAVPCGLGAAFYLSEYARPRTRAVVKPVLEILAGIPTVVFGFFALFFVNPQIVQRFWPFGDVGTFSGLAAGLVVGVMILPTMASLAEDAMAAVPGSLRDGALALGATRREVCTKVIFPAALSGIVAATVLAFSRAIGETTIVLLAAGSNPRFTLNPGEGVQTMASFIGFAGIGDQPTGSTGYKTIFAVGTLLFAITFVLNFLSVRVVRRFREVYE
ncbi:MAG TPA: phosphate ABC transporter permease subunit PstC [Acidimicrobiales bacterium]|nr:phosphate ABC transporter permease subunit PstC [Acidimicrobiales bacterium]